MSARGGLADEDRRIVDQFLELKNPSVQLGAPEAVQIHHVTAGQCYKFDDFAWRQLDSVSTMAPQEVLCDESIRAIEHQQAVGPKHPKALLEKSRQFVGPQVLGCLASKDQIHGAIGYSRHVVCGVRDPRHIAREVIGHRFVRLHAKMLVDRPHGSLEPIEIPPSVGADAEYSSCALRQEF